MPLHQKRNAKAQTGYWKGAYGKMRAALEARIKHNTLESMVVPCSQLRSVRSACSVPFCSVPFRSVPGFTNTQQLCRLYNHRMQSAANFSCCIDFVQVKQLLVLHAWFGLLLATSNKDYALQTSVLVGQHEARLTLCHCAYLVIVCYITCAGIQNSALKLCIQLAKYVVEYCSAETGFSPLHLSIRV